MSTKFPIQLNDFLKSDFNLLVFFVLGFLLSFSLPPYNYVSLCFLVFPILLYVLKINQSRNSKSFFLFGTLFSFGYFFSNLYWISNSLNFDPEVSILKPFAILGLPFCLSLFYGLGFYFLKKYFRFDFFFILSFSIILSLVEYLRSYITGFSWNLFAYALSDELESIQILNIIGTFGLNFLAILFFCFPFLFFCKSKTRSIIRIIAFIILIFANYFYGSSRLETKLIKKNQNILIVQPNESLLEIINYPEDYIDNLIKISNPKIQKDNTIFLWPEGSYSFLKQNNFSNIIKKNFRDNQKIILGGNTIDENRIYNTFLVYNSNGKQIDYYRKIHLVPFGEFIPFVNLLSKLNLKKVTFGYQSFSRGNNREVLKINDNKILPLICYEIINTGNINLNRQHYELILNISEDAWFSRSIGTHQHFAHSIFRSIEEGKHIFRSTNQGISSSINPLGKIIFKSNMSKQSIYIGDYYLLNYKTIFSIIGNLMFFLLIFFSLLIIIFSKRYFKL